MTFRIDRTRRAVSARASAGAGTDRGYDAQGARASNLPVVVDPVVRVHRQDTQDDGSTFAAQLMGQDGQKRGIRAGQPLIDSAQRAYARVEWSGAYDRRARQGRRTSQSI